MVFQYYPLAGLRHSSLSNLSRYNASSLDYSFHVYIRHLLLFFSLATPEEMADAKLPLGYRDNCAGLLITLNNCRKDGYFMPWACEHEMHEYESCQYYE